MTPRLPAAPLLLLLPLVALTPPARAGFPGFERRGFPPPRPNGTAPEGEPVPRVAAHRIRGVALKLDGKLDEETWREAEAGSGFLVWHPDRGRTPTEETIFKVAYDDRAVYFAVACLETDCTNIASSLSRRDRIRDSDLVSIYIDPYHDRDTGYNFRVNPEGVQEDYYLFADGRSDRDWDAVWGAETYGDEDGWYAEVRIPFSSIRFRARESMTWGLQVYRFMQRRGEDTAWVVWDREANGFVSRFGELTALESVPAPRQLELLPYFVQKTRDPSAPDSEDELDNFQNLGLDLEYGLTADLTLNATFQPDFGQVEADPAVLNLSPFETFFEEKRPFFIEGSRFYEMPEFNTFYSRRIGTGEESSRIRFAGKLTGKAVGNVSVAALYAATDVTGPGRAHNFLKRGERPVHYLVGRFGKDFADGNHRVHVMQTAALRSARRETEDDDGPDFRDGYTSGIDFDLDFRERAYNVAGSFIGSIVDPAPVAADPSIDHSARHGTGGQLSMGKLGGTFRGSVWGRWESEKLDLNDLGFLRAANEINSGAWVGWRYSSRGDAPRLNEANLNVNARKSWIHSGARVLDEDTGRVLWEYGPRHRQGAGGNINGYVQFRSFRGLWFGLRHAATRTDQHITRGGPLMTRPAETGGWLGSHGDWRKPVNYNAELSYTRDEAGGRAGRIGLEVHWNASNRIRLSTDLEYRIRNEKADYLDTIERDDPDAGIGGTSYVFADLDQKTVELTLRSSLLFSRDRSLEIYVQPFLTAGDYTNARELTTPDSDDLAPYSAGGFRAEDADFAFTAFNLNMVYRWEYRPGSTFYLVWTHSRSDFEERGEVEGPGFHNDLRAERLFDNEPENILLAKLTYWFSL